MRDEGRSPALDGPLAGPDGLDRVQVPFPAGQGQRQKGHDDRCSKNPFTRLLANLGAVRLVCSSAKCAAGMVASDCQCIGVVQQRWSRPTTACHCHRLQEIERSKLPAVLGVIAVIGPLPSSAMLLKDDMAISFLRTF